MTRIDVATASRFARVALGHVTREYPNKLDHVLSGDGDLRSPRSLHPIFYGSFDWHSCVHAYWLLARLLRTVRALPEAPAITALFDAQLTDTNVAGELAYAAAPGHAGFERPYGWAWLLALAGELSRGEVRWSRALAPLASHFATRLRDHLPQASYPIRTGSHASTAFALALALRYAEIAGDGALATQIRDKARAFYERDRGAPAWEPGGDDFLSPTLIEAECMRRVLAPGAFLAWLDAFLPELADRKPASLFVPAMVSNRADGKIAHLDGLNLSRAWCFRALCIALPEGDVRRPVLERAADDHLAASLPHVQGDYMGEHWLATYALLAIEAASADDPAA